MKLVHNPYAITASREEINTALETILQLPLAADDGKVFQFDTKSEAVMSKIIVYLKANPGQTTDWRLLDNSTVTVDGTALEAYYNQLALAQAARSFIVDPQYLNYKVNGATVEQLLQWMELYKNYPDISQIP